ncbi:MAG: 4Fe-4S cluster-binding domain-containing protein [Candidatus Kaiserbacteria bacterium]|nr:4Fe-4S cluster-binding domain-containing protein [Candidatus Kaiserbacteria bacterium]
MNTKLLQSAEDIHARFPHIPTNEISQISDFNKRFRFGVSQEMLDYLEKDEHGVPLRSDPLAQLFWPFPDLLTAKAPSAYDPLWDNWEMPGDFPIPGNWAWQWKYTDRILHRSFGCEQKCLHCFETIRVLDKNGQKKPRPQDWSEGLTFIRAHSKISEVIFSGGEPLVVPDSLLEQRFADVRSIPHVRIIRIHTAKGIHDTDRFSDSFTALCKKFSVTEIAFHILHPRQVTPRFIAAMERLARGCGSVIRLAHIPILRGVNDDTEVLKELCTRLVECGVRPYYFLHSMPGTLGARRWRLSVSRMADVVRPIIGRGFSHMRAPEAIIVSRGGKKTIPMERNTFLMDRTYERETVWAIDGTMPDLDSFGWTNGDDWFGYSFSKNQFIGTPDFIYTKFRDKPVIVFKNWKGKWEMYPDVSD